VLDRILFAIEKSITIYIALLMLIQVVKSNLIILKRVKVAINNFFFLLSIYLSYLIVIKIIALKQLRLQLLFLLLNSFSILNFITFKCCYITILSFLIFKTFVLLILISTNRLKLFAINSLFVSKLIR